MNTTAAFLALLAGLVVWWLIVRQLTTRSWETHAAGDPGAIVETLGVAPQKVGLWILLAVITSLFGLFITAYVIRMSPHPIKGVALGDWQPLPKPQILWLNTLALVLASAGMQLARFASQRGRSALMRAGWLAGGMFALAFLAGQIAACRQLQAAGYYAAGNPANAFFYVLTMLHGLHLTGGLVAWTATTGRIRRADAPPGAALLGVELCTVYWHYLLVVWLVLFGLLLAT